METKAKKNYYQERKKYDIQEREYMRLAYSHYATVPTWEEEYIELPADGLVDGRVASVLMVKMLTGVYVIECAYKGKCPTDEIDSTIFSRAWDKCFDFLQGKVLTGETTADRVWFPEREEYGMRPELAYDEKLEKVLGVDWGDGDWCEDWCGRWLYQHMVEVEVSELCLVRKMHIDAIKHVVEEEMARHEDFNPKASSKPVKSIGTDSDVFADEIENFMKHEFESENTCKDITY